MLIHVRGEVFSRLGKERELLKLWGDRGEGYGALFYVHQLARRQLCGSGDIWSAAGLEEEEF